MQAGMPPAASSPTPSMLFVPYRTAARTCTHCLGPTLDESILKHTWQEAWQQKRGKGIGCRTQLAVSLLPTVGWTMLSPPAIVDHRPPLAYLEVHTREAPQLWHYIQHISQHRPWPEGLTLAGVVILSSRPRPQHHVAVQVLLV